MATAVINEFIVEIPGANQLRFRVNFTLNQTATEARLEIPSHVWLTLMQKKGADIDTIHLFADGSTTLDREGEPSAIPSDPLSRPPISQSSSTKDIPAAGWEYAGLYASSGTHMYSFTRNTEDLPSDSDTEEWYIILVVCPDILSSVAYSAVIPANI